MPTIHAIRREHAHTAAVRFIARISGPDPMRQPKLLMYEPHGASVVEEYEASLPKTQKELF